MADLGNTIVRGKLRVTDEIVGPLNVVNLSTGSNGQFLSISNNVPTWVNSPNTNTWRPVVDNLTSTATDQSLSANQGRVLKSYIDTYFTSARVGNDSVYSGISTSFIGGVSGGPRINNWEFLYRAEHRNGSGDGPNYIMEMVSNLTSDSSIYWRKKTGPSANFTAFREIIDSNNIGSQSVKYATTAGTANSIPWSSVSGKPTDLVKASSLTELTLVNNTSKRYLIGSADTTIWNNMGTDTSCYMYSNSLYAKNFFNSSDRRLKENIKDLDLNCLDLVTNISLREFSWKSDKEHTPTLGVIAQELKQVLPEKYTHEFIGGKEHTNEYLSINESKLVYILIGAVQEQQKEIEQLKSELNNLRATENEPE